MSVQKNLESQLAQAMTDEGDIPEWVPQYKFNQPTNQMTFDFAWPEYKVAIEVNGGQWSSGKMGHNSGMGVERDARKQNYAALQGWLLLIFVTDHIEKKMSQYTIPAVREALRARGANVPDYEKAISDMFNENKKELV